ncbi:rhomboid family intramembrane serine protease [Tannockella kyphosi]|uniref:rhomboid family intramembrane serine protease n=1 Tax=Tannockella kyphosi TaxID=2899121 RepID=UPI0020136753|nr:rhomboid family intramembrane serine protease [Tannockella kyphosi]
MEKLKKCPITTSLIVTSFVVYLFTFILYGETMSAYEGLEMGAFNPVVVLYYKEYYRLVFANFLHFGVFHVAINCYSLYNVGTILERLVGIKNMIWVVVVSTFSTSLVPLASYLLFGSGANTVLAGISGIVCGLVGALFVLCYEYKDRFGDFYRSLSTNIGIMILLSITISSVSLSGHLGGLLGGSITMYCILQIKKKKRILH